MKREIDRSVFTMFRKSTMLLTASFAPILIYLLLYDGLFLKQVTSGSNNTKLFWAQAYPIPFIVVTVLIATIWLVMYYTGRTMRRDSVAMFLGRESRQGMSLGEYREGIYRIRKAYNEHFR